MTEKRANEILHTKYPNGRIFRRNSMGGVTTSAIAVEFNEYGKVYSYQAKSYQEVLDKLGFCILYKHNVEALNIEKHKLEQEINEGGYEPILDLLHRDYVEYTEEEIAEKKNRIAEIDNMIATYIID